MFTLSLVCLVLIAGNAFFVAMELSLIRVRSSRIELLARHGDPRAVQVQEMLRRLDDYMAAFQLGITVLSLALGWIGEPALAVWLELRLGALGVVLPGHLLHGLAFALGLSLLSMTQLVLGELVPRAVGIQRAEVISLWGSYPMRAYARAIRPLVALMSGLSKAVLKILGFKPAAETESTLSEEEMRVLLGENQEKGSFPLERLLLLENLFDLGRALVADAMVPAEKVAFLSVDRSWAENMEVVRLRRFSRYPLCAGGLDGVFGMIHVKDLVLKAPAPDLRMIKRDVAAVFEGESLEKLVKAFPDKGIHMAVVKNAQGHVTGLITLEDILEEIVGEINDEFDLPLAWNLADLVVGPAVAVGLQASDKKAAVAALLSRLKAAAPELNEEEVLKAVMDREAKLSSAVGRGAAVPHARLANLSRPFIAVGRFARPIPGASPDNVPVRLVFLILTPVSTPIVQLKILSRIAALLTNENLRRKLLRAKTGEALLETLRTADTLLAA